MSPALVEFIIGKGIKQKNKTVSVPYIKKDINTKLWCNFNFR